MDELTDAMLIRRSLLGDEGATTALFRRHYRAAFAVALATSASYADAEDACQDGLTRAVSRLSDCRQPERFAQWLFAIVRNTAKNRLTRDPAHRSEPLDADTAHSPDDPGIWAEQRDLRERLTRALSAISPVQREVVLLHDLEGATHEMIAGQLGMSVVMSRQHLFQARRRLRHILGPEFGKEFSNE